MPDRTNFQMAAFGYGNKDEYLVHVIAVLRVIKQKGMEQEVRTAFHALVEVRREMKPFLNSLMMRQRPRKRSKSKSFLSTRKFSRPRRVLRSLKPRRHTKCSVALLLASCKLSGTRLSTRCSPKIRGLA
jgi:hypothetical protein